LVINELWIDGYNKPILINVINVPIHAFQHSQLQWTSAVYKQTNIPVVFNYLLLILVCLFFYFSLWMNLFHTMKKFPPPLLVCSVWNYAKRHFIGHKQILNLKAFSWLVVLDIEFPGDDRAIFRVGFFHSLAVHCKTLNIPWNFHRT
jgi:hypothetical protein